MKKTIWLPIVFGLIAAAMGFLITYAGLTIYTGEIGGVPTGYDFREVFITIASAIGGPLATVLATLQFPLIFLHLQLPVADSLMVVADRLGGGLWVAFAFNLLCRVKKVPLFILGWIGAVVIYYTIFMNGIDAIWTSIAEGTPFLDTYLGLFAPPVGVGFLVEVAVTSIFTSIMWIALPQAYRRPFWYESKRDTASTEEKA